MEAKEHSQGVEWVKGRGQFRPWVTESTADADEPWDDEFMQLPEPVRQQLLKSVAEGWPKWKSPLEE
jgi:hypothetical protein